jgi:hypothetical protein
MAALGLALAFSFSACDNPTQVEGTVGISSQDGLDVTATAVKGGVLLEWNPVLDGGSYKIWRVKKDAKYTEGEDEKDVKPVDITPPSYLGNTDKATGKRYVLDVMNDDNLLEANTEYVYTIITSGNSKTDSKTEVEVKTGAIPAKDTQLDPAKNVTLKLDDENGKITVSWDAFNPKTDSLPIYKVDLLRNGGRFAGSGNNITYNNTYTYDSWNFSSQETGDYTAVVTVQPPSGNTYFKESTRVASAKESFESLFIANPSVTVSTSSYSENASGTLDSILARIEVGSKIKTGVTFTVKRAPVDAAGNVGSFEPAALVIPWGNSYIYGTFDTDPLGYVKNTVYDKLPVAVREYKYQITATKEVTGAKAKTQTVKLDSIVKTDPRNLAARALGFDSIRIASPSIINNIKTYSVQPRTLDFKGALQSGDKLVFYYTTDNPSSAYTKSIEFSKEQLEVASPVPQNLQIPAAFLSSTIYVQVYLEFADGRERVNVVNYSLHQNYSGSGSDTGGVDVKNSYWDGTDNIYYARLYN